MVGTPPLPDELNPGWVVVAACALVMFGTWNSHTGFGVFLPVLSREFGWSRGAISVAASLQLLVGGAIALAVGAASDRYGPRLILAPSALLAGAAFVLTSGVNALWHFYLLQGFLLGIGMASIYLVPTTTVSRWFVAQRGFALGILLAFHNLSFITGPPLSASLINLFGWRTAYLLLGGVVWCVALPASAFTRFPNDSERKASLPLVAARESPGSFQVATLWQALANRRLWLLTGSWLLLGFAWMMLAVHLVSYVKDQGATLEAASLTLTIFGIGSIIGRLLFGVTADKFGTKPTFWLCLILQIVALMWFLTGPLLGVLYFLMLVFGMGAAGSDTTVVKAAVEVFGVRALGTAMGVMNVGWRCGAALGPAAAGFIYDVTGSYLIAFSLASGALAGSFALFTLALAALGHQAVRAPS